MTQAETEIATGHTDHGHGDGHPEHLQHHFETMPQQLDTAKLGMWLFLGTELLMFAGLFCLYAVWRSNQFEAFGIGYEYLDKIMGAINTVVLIASSFTMACPISAQHVAIVTSMCTLILNS